MQRETDLYEQIAQYLNLKYPKIIYHFDLSGLWTPSHKARNLYGRLNSRAYPDLFIAYGRYYDNTYTQGEEWHGLFIELKREGAKIYRKDGSLYANEHLREQADMLVQLEQQGYKAVFGVGFEATKKIIDNYLLYG